MPLLCLIRRFIGTCGSGERWHEVVHESNLPQQSQFGTRNSSLSSNTKIGRKKLPSPWKVTFVRLTVTSASIFLPLEANLLTARNTLASPSYYSLRFKCIVFHVFRVFHVFHFFTFRIFSCFHFLHVCDISSVWQNTARSRMYIWRRTTDHRWAKRRTSAACNFNEPPMRKIAENQNW